MTLNTGEFHSGEDEFVSLPISTGSQRQTFYLTLNCGEKPRVPNPTKLSEILEETADEKYRLSSKACQGILNRAERRGKELPKELKEALMMQSALPETESTEPTPQDATDQDGAGGAASPLTQSTDQPSLTFQERAGKPGGGEGNLDPEREDGSLIHLEQSDGPSEAIGFLPGQSAKALGLGLEIEKAPTLKQGGGWCSDKTGPLCASDYKGVGNQFVQERKIVIDNYP